MIISLILTSLYQAVIWETAKVKALTIICCRSAAKHFVDKPILVGEDEQNNTSSETDLSDFHIGSTKSTVGCVEG